MKQKHVLLLVAAAFFTFALLARLTDHIPNFSPIGALALLSGYYLPRRYSWMLVITALFVSDFVLGFYHIGVMVAVYGSYLLIWLLGYWAKRSTSKWSLIPGSLSGSVLFFTITNFAVWAFTPLYAKTLTGLQWSYTMGIPFFKWTLAGDLLYGAALVLLVETVLLVVHRAYRPMFSPLENV